MAVAPFVRRWCRHIGQHGPPNQSLRPCALDQVACARYRMNVTDIVQTAADELGARVRERFDRFQQSSRTIGNFVSDSQKSVAGIIQRNAGNLTRLQTSELADDEPEEDDAATVTLGEDEVQYLTKLLSDHGGMLQQYPQILFEMAFIYFVAAFEAYMQDVIELTLRYRPEILKSASSWHGTRLSILFRAARSSHSWPNVRLAS